MIIEVDDPEDFLEHFGVKGMKWGERKALIKASNQEVRDTKDSHKEGLRDARKDQNFRREVRATKKGRGISGVSGVEKTKQFGRVTGRITGDFRDSKGNRVSEDFANAVAHRAMKQKDFVAKAKIGAVFVASILIITR